MPDTDSYLRPLRCLALLLLLAMGLAPRFLEAATDQSAVPRFATLRASEVNLRAGPGEQYPIEWVFTHKNLPVEIVAEFKVWRKIRDADGTEGWVHERMVTGRRSVLVRGQMRQLHSRPAADAAVVARVEPGVVAGLIECQAAWCRIEAGGVKGWLKRDEVWGVYPDEVIQ